MKYLFLLLLTGCVHYTLEPIELASGKVVCCKGTLYNSKNYDYLNFTLKREADGTTTAILQEGGVESISPEAVETAKQVSKLVAPIM